ncbi:MAG: low molecular weight phosphotyrosine protein phosphatase [Thiomargarita sp.]|nr:low molecular weight phosphotyrosine protein phosphatase [Thiomargarita sp.]
MVKVLFVCMGNICRSPTAEGVFRKLVQEADLEAQIEIDSAGTHAYHIGEQPDRRSQKVALKRGINLSDLRGRQVQKSDFKEFDYVLTMDKDNYNSLQYFCPQKYQKKLRLFLSFAPQLGVQEVPDPYFGEGDKGFEYVLDLVEAASAGLLVEIRQQHLD